MKKLFLIIISIIIISPSSFAVTYNSDPKIFVTELVDDAIKILSDKSKVKRIKQLKLKKLL